MQIFFYGLFMDKSILAKNGLEPTYIKKGYLNDYVLKIGNRASLIPCKHERAYGLVMTVDDEDIERLYAEPSVADYIAEEVVVTTDENESINAICYNLQEESLSGTNPTYAQSLFELAKKLKFPIDYLVKIKAFAS